MGCRLRLNIQSINQSINLNIHVIIIVKNVAKDT